VLACFATHVLSVLRRGYFCPLKPLNCNGIYAVILICRVSRHLELCSPAGRSCLSGCHTFCTSLTCWLLPCSFCRSVHFIHYSSSLTPHRQPHTSTVLRSLVSFQFLTLHSLSPSSPCFAHPQRSSKKMRQPCCQQHPATALRATRVRGTPSTRGGSPTTHRLKTSFRYSSFRL
jgi:hypothetical protein